MTGPDDGLTREELTAAIIKGARQLGATRLAAAAAAGLAADGATGPLHPDIIAGIEQLTGETYDPETGTWSGDTG
jgi:hypothetical protein